MKDWISDLALTTDIDLDLDYTRFNESGIGCFVLSEF